MRRLALLVVFALAGCTRGPSYEELMSAGYDELQRGNLPAARARAGAGRRLAGERHDPSWERKFRVLDAEALVEDWRLAEALAVLDAEPPAVEPPDPLDVRVLMSRGLARCFSRGGPESQGRARADLDEAGRLAARLRSAELASDVTIRLGTCAALQEDYATAESRFREALASARAQHRAHLEAKATGSLGFIRLRTGRIDEAADWFARALALASGLQAHIVEIKTLTNLGNCYYVLGDYDRALGFLFRAKELATEGRNDAERLYALQNIGNAHYRLRRLDAAREDYRQALAIAREIGDKYVAGELLSNLGTVDLEEGRYDAAEASVREALRVKAELDNVTGRLHSLLAEGQIWAGRGSHAKAEALYREVLGSPHSGRELLWETRASVASLCLKTRRPTEAEAEFRKAFAIMEESRDELRKPDHKISFFSSLGRFYDDYVDLLVAEGKTRQALEVADRSRARLLREMLQGDHDIPNARVGRFQTAAAGLDAVILFYWLAPARSFLWAITPRKVERYDLPGEEDIGKRVEAHQALVLAGRDPLVEGAPAAAWLYDTLIGPAEALLPEGSRVVFVPDGALHQINPETLVVASPEPHYWIEDVTLQAAPSVSVLAAAAARPARPVRKARSILLLGDPLPAGEEFPRLAFASREIGRIADQFAPSDRVVYTGAQADPSVYRSSGPGQFSFIHIAAHAQGNQAMPLESAVVLSAKDESSKLYAREIAEVPLRADLVTLSACRGAGSRTYVGEGLVGLTWAFLSSGAANVIAGLWNVEDASTSEMMAGLYHALGQGQRPAEALRQVKLGLLRSRSANRKPFYWAPFMVYTRGAGAPLR